MIFTSSERIRDRLIKEEILRIEPRGEGNDQIRQERVYRKTSG